MKEILLPNCFLTAGGIAGELLWTNQEFYNVDIIPLWFSMLIYHLGDEQYARWLPQFRDVVLRHRQAHHQDLTFVIKGFW
jgi:hypothetical protein